MRTTTIVLALGIAGVAALVLFLRRQRLSPGAVASS